MKILIPLWFLSFAATISASDKTEVVESFSRDSGPISLFLVDKTSFLNVKIISTRGDNWIQIRYTPQNPPIPVPSENAKLRKPKLCWVNVDHIARIVQNEKAEDSGTSK